MAGLTRPVALIAGSGISLLPLLDRKPSRRRFADFDGLPETTVEGHPGTIATGERNGAPLIVQEGRIHVYEGHSPQEAGRTIDVLQQLGARSVVITSAVGGLLPDLAPGDLVAPDKVVLWPYARWPEAPHEIEIDAVPQGVQTTGAYMWMHGPCYETRAEIDALRAQGGSVVGMSVAPELVRARQRGMPSAVISCVTNVCGSDEPLSHREVVATAQKSQARLLSILAGLLDGLR